MQHFTRNTVEASEWCRKCGKRTMHRIDGVKLGPCLDCIAKLETEHAKPKQPETVHENLFDTGKEGTR